MDPRPSEQNPPGKPLPSQGNKLLPARLAVLVAVVFWGISFVATKVVLREIPPTALMFSRSAIGSVLLLVLMSVRGTSPLPPRGTWLALASMGFIGIFLHQLLQSFGLVTAPATHAGWLIGLIPIWSALLSAAVLKEKFGWLKVTGLAGGFVGAVLVISGGSFGPSALHLPSTQGDFLILLSTINWALYTVLSQGTIKRLGPLRATAAMMLFGTLMLAPLFFLHRDWLALTNLSKIGWSALLFLGICCSGLAYLFWYDALEHIEVSRVAAFLYLEPFVTLLTAMALLQENVIPVTFAGGLLVLLSVFVLQRAP